MKRLNLFIAAMAVALPHAYAAENAPPAPQGGVCATEGNVQYLCGQRAEDLVLIPGTDWVLASGNLRAINVRDKSIVPLYPAPTYSERFDAKTYSACAGAPVATAPARGLGYLGLAIREGKNGLHTLYITDYSGRKVQVLEVDVRGKAPKATWIGCVPIPEDIGLNSIVPVPNTGGFIMSTWQPPGAPDAFAKMEAGEINGALHEWQPGKGWTTVPGSETSGGNGLEISKDGKVIYAAGWGNKTFFRVTRGANPPKRDTIQLDFRMDNLHWAPDGTLLGAGTTDTASSKVVKINPDTLKVTELVNMPDGPAFGHASVAIQVGNELWIDAVRADRIAIMPLPK